MTEAAAEPAFAQAPSDDLPPARFLLRDAAWLILAFMGAQVAAVLVYVAIVFAHHGRAAGQTLTSSNDGLNRLVVVGGVASVIAVAFVLWRIVRRRRATAATFGLVSPGLRWWLFSVAAFLLLQGLVMGIDHVAGEDIARQGLDTMRGTVSSDPRWNAVSFLLVAFVIPAVEEIVFRVVLFRALAQRLPQFAAAVLAVAFFVAMHVQYTLAGGLVAVFMTLEVTLIGATLMWLYVRSGSIWPSIAVHMANNALAFILVSLSH